MPSAKQVCADWPNIWSRPYTWRPWVEASIRAANTGDNLAGAEWLPFSQQLLLFDDGKTFSGLSGRATISAVRPLFFVDHEIRALLDHAALCRRVAAEISHANAANRLRLMAEEYEARAFGFAAADERLFRETDGIVDNLANVQK